MQRGVFLIPATILAMTISFAGRAAADDDDYPTWLPSSEAAVSVTGPVILFPDRFNAGQANFPWKEDSVVAQFKPDQGPDPGPRLPGDPDDQSAAAERRQALRGKGGQLDRHGSRPSGRPGDRRL